MSDSRAKRSPYEQGELKPSPEVVKKKKSSKKSKKSHKLPPEAKVHVRNDDDDDVQIIEAGDHGEEEGGSLTIKPPQAHPMRQKERSHKHKKEKHRSRDHSIPKERVRQEKAAAFQQRGWKSKEPNPPQRDAREIVRERKKERALKEKEIAREMKEREARKREESIKESTEVLLHRERLERMELERRRDRQMREEKVIEKQPQPRPMKRKEERGHYPDSRREKMRKEDKMQGDHRSRSRDMSREQGQGRHFPPPPRLQEDKGQWVYELVSGASEILEVDIRVEKSWRSLFKKESKRRLSRSPSQSPRSEEERLRPGSDQDTRMVVVEDKDDGVSDKSFEEMPERKRGSEVSSSGKGDVQEAEADDEDDGEEEESDDSDSDSDDSDSDSSSGEEEESSEEEEEEEAEDREDSPGKNLADVFKEDAKMEETSSGKVRSKFDDHSDVESIGGRSDRSQSDDYMPESPELSDVEMKPEDMLPPYLPAIQEIVVGSNMDKIYIVMDFVEHDLKSLMESMKNPFLVGEVKTLLRQLLRAVRHLHDNWILHRDLKTSNLLLSHRGILKVGDFGLAREYGSPLRHYTPVVVTLWYRAPELLLGCKEYSTHVDMWSVGCIFAELLLMKALWPGKSEIDQLNRIFKDLGTPTETIWPGMSELPGCKKVTFNNHVYNVVRNRFGSYFTDLGFDLMNKLFTYDPSKRITAEGGLEHEYFSESPLPVDPSFFPTWPARSEEGRKHASSPKPPSGGKAYQKLMDDEETFAAGGFHMPSAAKGASAQGMGFSLKF
ncbi:cyclin-dependent kinase 11B [Aplysia californica]|uniref:Cyclin-dependent kinase 11B n=1 Tax=Aplysia californica TaxID=6500 RepID=A0ABM1VTN4_APLCA|nr:cyclin-dependent kinase 11B [Aplysia californica]